MTSESARIPIDSVPPQISKPTQEIPATEVAQPPMQHPLPTGYVDAADLVLPEPEAALEQNETASPPAHARPSELLTGPSETVELVEPVEQTEPPIPQPQQDSKLPNSAPDFTEATPSPPRPAIESPPQTSAPELTSPEEPINTSIESEPRRPAEVMPPPVDIPTLADLPQPSPHQTEPVSAPTPVVQAVPEPPKNALPKEPRSVRPMTAASASIIGELTPRRRALSLFGLRRR